MNNQNKQKENPLLNISLNIIIPALILMKGGKWLNLSPTFALTLALIFPITYGVYDFIKYKKYNFFSILGFVSILLTGGIGLLKLPKEWIAIKEASIPLAIGIVIFASQKTRYPLIRKLLFNDALVNVEKIETSLKENNQEKALDKLLKKCTWMVTASFILSAILNFILARVFIQNETGTQAFTEELGKMTAWSYPVIALPCTIVMMLALWSLFKGIKGLTGLEIEDIFKNPAFEKQKQKD